MANLPRYLTAAGFVAFGCLAGVVWTSSPARAGASADAADADDQRPAPGEHELEGRLIAPCCWTQTLDIHDSPIAAELRHEIRHRLHAGEASIAIEDDLAQRYGANIRAVPRGRDPRTTLPFVLSIAMALSVFALVWVGRKWLRKSGPTTEDKATERAGQTPEGLEYDARLDAELKRSTE